MFAPQVQLLEFPEVLEKHHGAISQELEEVNNIIWYQEDC